MFLPFRWVAGNERGEKSYVAAILCCAARANLEGVASCSTTLSSSTSGQDPPPPLRPPAGFYAAPSRRILLLPPFPSPVTRRPRSCSPLSDSRIPIDCRFCIICQDPNSLMHVPLRHHLTSLPVRPFLIFAGNL